MVEKKENKPLCQQTASCYTLLRRYSVGFLPVELLGEPCGGSSGRCEGHCAVLKSQRHGAFILSSPSAKFTMKTIQSPKGLTFPNYLHYLSKRENHNKGHLDLDEPMMMPPSQWDRRYWIALHKGIICGIVYAWAVLSLEIVNRLY